MHKMMLACFVIVAMVSCSFAVPVYNAAPVYNPAPAYNVAPSYKSQDYLFPLAIQNGYGASAPPAPPSILYATSSNPSASSSSAASNSGLNAGNYKQLVVPSYLLLGSEVVNPAGGYANIPSYGSKIY